MDVIGIDPSLTGSAVCRMSAPDDMTVRRFTSSPSDGLAGRIDRYRTLVDKIVRELLMRQVSYVAIEGYSYGSHGGSAMLNLAEFGGILRMELLRSVDCPVVEVPPACLKQFATGKGIGDKLVVALAVQKRWNVTFTTSDEYDAYVLGLIALCLSGGMEPENQAQRTVIDRIMNPQPKKRRSSRAKEPA